MGFPTYFHHLLTVHSEVPASHHLEVYSSQRQRPPFTCRFFLYLRNFGGLGGQASFKENDNSSSIEEMDTPPKEVGSNPITIVGDLNRPEWFGFEIFHPEISIDYESQSRELA